jgi:hypothetical protein
VKAAAGARTIGVVGRVVTVVLSLLIALAAAACGGDSSGSATGTVASGAEIAPANVVGFFSINTDDESDQWKQGSELLDKFPITERARAEIERELTDEGVDLRRDVLPALGPTLDVVLLDGAGDERQVVGMTQPENEQRFAELLEKADESLVHTTIEGWTVFTDDQATLNAFRAADDKLENSDAFTDAMAELPEEANTKVFLNGSGALGAIGREVPGFSVPESGEFEWVAFAVSSHDDGWKLDGAAKGGGAEFSGRFDRALLDVVPSGALAAIVFKGAGASALEQLRKDPQLSQASAQLEQLLGVRIEDLVELLSGDTVLYVRQGSPFPEVTLVTKPDDTERALRTLDNAAGRISAFAGGAPPSQTKIGSVSVRRIPLGRVTLLYGVGDGKLVASTSTSPFRTLGGAALDESLEDDPVYSDAADAADLPEDANALIYVNVRESIAVLEGFALVSGDPLPREASDNLEPLESLFGYSTYENGIGKFSGLLQVS